MTGSIRTSTSRKSETGRRFSNSARTSTCSEQGDLAEAVFYIQKGKVKLTVLSDQGKEAVVAILGPGQFFGEGCMNGHKLRISTTTAMEDCIDHGHHEIRDDRRHS